MRRLAGNICSNGWCKRFHACSFRASHALRFIVCGSQGEHHFQLSTTNEPRERTTSDPPSSPAWQFHGIARRRRQPRARETAFFFCEGSLFFRLNNNNVSLSSILYSGRNERARSESWSVASYALHYTKPICCANKRLCVLIRFSEMNLYIILSV